MKKLIYLLFIVSISCKSQESRQNTKKIDLSNREKMNYIFSRIYSNKPISKELYNQGLFITVFKMSDPKATPEGLFKGYDGTLVSYIISVKPDGDYYSWSKLYMIEGLINPVILKIEEAKYPNFTIQIQHGFFDNRIVEEFKIVGK